MTTRRPSRRYEQRKNAIIASAVEVINHKGVRGMTLGDVAACLDLVPTGLIYYFKNKEELAAACFLRGVERFNQLIEAASAEEDTRRRLVAFIEGYFEFRRRAALREVEQIAVFNDVRAIDSPAVNDAYVDMFRAARRLFDGGQAPAMERRERNARTHLLLSELFWAVVWLPKSDPEDYPRAASRLVSILTDGLAAPGASWNPVPLPPLLAESGPSGADSSEMFLRAATQLINEQGYVGASVEKISARLNVTKRAFYHHNQTKDDLVLACFERTLDVMRRAIRAAESASSSGYQTLATAAEALVAYQLSGAAPLLRTSALTSLPESLQGELVWKFDRISDRFASLISDGIADGSLRPVDANLAAQSITAMVNAAAELEHWAPGAGPQAASAIYVRPLFEGLLSPPHL